jgi:hypothetical protein
MATSAFFIDILRLDKQIKYRLYIWIDKWNKISREYYIKDKTYLGNIDKELYKKLDKGSKIEVLEYKGKTIMYDSYDVK